jgi:hypothetical protein
LEIIKEKKANIYSGAVVVAIQDQVSTSLEDEAVILNLKDGVYYGLDPIGARIWELVQQPRGVGAIRNIILKEYEVDPERCEQDLVRLLQDLAARGLIEVPARHVRLRHF